MLLTVGFFSFSFVLPPGSGSPGARPPWAGGWLPVRSLPLAWGWSALGGSAPLALPAGVAPPVGASPVGWASLPPLGSACVSAPGPPGVVWGSFLQYHYFGRSWLWPLWLKHLHLVLV